ncbi:Tol-Pal system beta propeller repeat protein TolB [Rhodopila globiformis]|uniref:Tol-Pal system protein TolB n=1 Tax=Rhodopila globiformis TaxID=1071 RepID=A0A2S6NLU7_RHOGL|nr:Tol-Pal system beta propeller repeat protein TolB [Rhodopila globiformis]PPQ36583.1 Tol-Pal system beta propeller repeat protein TolB [Rhodopila globiformis]
MNPISTPSFSRRGLIAGAAGLLAAAPIPVLAQQAGGSDAPSAVIDVNRARTAPIPIAVPDLGGADGASEQMGRDIAGVISNDLARSGLFRMIDHAAFIQSGASGGTPNLQNWRPTGAQALVTGSVQMLGGGQLRVEFRLWDILPGTQIQGTAYTTTVGNWRRIAHIMADVIYERLLGEKGYFDTRIVYVSATGPRDRRTKRLAIMDQDSENNRMLTDGRWLVLTPRFHPTRDLIAFMSYANNRPRVYLFDLQTGRQTQLGEFPGMTFAPRFAPDGNSLLMAVSNGEGSDIVSVDLHSRASRRLTNSGSIDVSPCYSPDGSQIVFASDRGGDQQIYVMGAGGGGARRISYGNGRYGTPVWSPRGDLIAFTRYAGDTANFAIGVMHPDGSGERILSEGWMVEGPTFAPNGRVLMFWRETRGSGSRGAGFSSRLVSVDITGFNERVAPTPTDASDPAWSPLGG